MGRSLVSILASRFGRRTSQLERRRFLQQSLAASTALLLSSTTSVANYRSAGERGRVVIVGAGFSGLACAYELKHAGFDVTVIESRGRVGGRVLSANANNGREFLRGRNLEFGAELIGSNHPLWVAYAEQFKLTFLDVTEDETAELPVVIDGKKLSASAAEQLWVDMESGLEKLNQLAAQVNVDEPWNSSNARQLDLTSIQDWINGLDVEPLTKRALWINQTADNGQDAERQSLLGQLTSVKGGGLERYWTESEVYRCRGGNDQLATKLAESVGNDRIRTRVAVQSITLENGNMVVETSDGRRIECDDVVLTAPPKTWSKIVFNPALPEDLRPQTGFNAKYFAAVRDRFWEQSVPKISQYALSDDVIHMTWDGTDDQGAVDENIEGACLVGFNGGSVCERMLRMNQAERDLAFAESFERFFPGFKNQVLKTIYMDWPNDPWAAASYSFPAPGQVTTVGPKLVQPYMDGRLHLAGEHTCYKFVGYMEGALQSGARVAKTIAARELTLAN